MAIAHRETGTATFGINSFSPAIPASQVTGDMMLLFVYGKPYNGSYSVSGWTQLGSFTDGGNAAAGVDSGSMVVTVFYKEAASDTETNPTVTEGATTWNVFGAHVQVWSKGAGETWDAPVAVGGGDTAGPAISITCNADPGITAGDAVSVIVATPSDSDTPTAAPFDWTATGITAATDTRDPATDPETTTGGDMSVTGVRSLSITGTSSAAPVIAGTLANSHRASGILVRLRVSAGGVTGDGALTINLSGAADGSVLVQGDGAGTVNISTAADGSVLVQGDGAATINVSGAGEADVLVQGDGAGTVQISGAGDAGVLVSADGAASVQLTAAGDGVVIVPIEGDGALTIQVGTAGEAGVLIQADGATTIQLSASASGVRIVEVSYTGAWYAQWRRANTPSGRRRPSRKTNW